MAGAIGGMNSGVPVGGEESGSCRIGAGDRAAYKARVQIWEMLTVPLEECKIVQCMMETTCVINSSKEVLNSDSANRSSLLS